MKPTRIGIFILLSCCTLFATAQKPKGKLFIIGGGDRTNDLMLALISEVEFAPADYAVVLPMSSVEPDSAFIYFRDDFIRYSKNKIGNLNFTQQNSDNRKLLDSLEHAKLIFITGGDQNRFMEIVLNSPVYEVIHRAYENGSIVAGTSAGAAMMGKYMITGNQLLDTTYYSTFYSIEDNNIEIKQGLSLIENAVIDQHFVVRSRYNRLFCAIEAYPHITGVGIDEATAVVVEGNKIEVVGESQVVYIRNKGKIKRGKNNRIGFEDVRIKIFLPGDKFRLN